MKVTYKKLTSIPCYGIIETWNLKENVLSRYVHPSEYGFEWETCEKEIDELELVNLIEKCVWIKKVEL